MSSTMSLSLWKETSGIILPDSPTQRVGGELLKGFEPHRHSRRLWSLDKAQNVEDLLAWNSASDANRLPIITPRIRMMTFATA